MNTATLEITTDERITTRRAKLMKQRAERKDEDDLSRTMTTREVRDYLAETATLDKEIAAFNTTVGTWAARPTLDADTKWLAHLHTWRDTISAERLAIRSPIRDKLMMELAQGLEWSIKLIDHGFAANRLPVPIIDLSSTRIGQLMAAAGYDVVGLELLRGPNGFRGSLPDTEQRIRDLTRQRAAAQAALDAVLLTDEERATQDAESAQLRDAFNAMRCTYVDGGYVAHDEYGDVLDPANMTAIQTRAIERMNALEQQYRQSVIDRQTGRG